MPKEFWTASRAVVFITENLEQDQAFLTVHLERGFKFPRKYLGAMQASVEETECGPMEIPSPIKEDVKFMNVFRLRELYSKPADSRKLSATISVSDQFHSHFPLDNQDVVDAPKQLVFVLTIFVWRCQA